MLRKCGRDRTGICLVLPDPMESSVASDAGPGEPAPQRQVQHVEGQPSQKAKKFPHFDKGVNRVRQQLRVSGGAGGLFVSGQPPANFPAAAFGIAPFPGHQLFGITHRLAVDVATQRAGWLGKSSWWVKCPS